MALAKLTRPRLGRLLDRPRLFRLLDARRPLAWVWGPPGAGKTALVGSWADARGRRVVWIQCDAADTSAEAFVEYLGRAARGTASGAPVSSSGAVREAVRALFERMRAPFVVVLDGYQEIPADSPVHEAVRIMVEEMPPRAKVVVTSRAESPGVFARLRASCAVAEIGWTDLRLTARESRALVRRREPGFPPRLLATLHERAAGWAAGLVLMLQERRGLADERRRAPDGIVDYFTFEVFARVDADTQAVLLQTAFLPRLTPAMAAALTGRPQAGEILARLHRQNAFTVEHAAASAMYEYHSLFRAFLLRRAYAVLTVDQRADLQRRAAMLLEEDGQVGAAGALLRDAGDWTGLARLVETRGAALVDDGDAETLRAWIAAIPPETTQQRPGLLLRRAAARVVTEPAAARTDLETALALFRRSGDAAGAFTAWAMAVETVFVEQDDFHVLDTWIATFEGLTAEFPGAASPRMEPAVVSSMLLALVYRQPQHRDMAVWVRRALECAEAAGEPDARLRVLVGVLTYQLWVGDFERAASAATKVRALLRSPGIRAVTRDDAHLLLARAAWLTGDFVGAAETIEASAGPAAAAEAALAALAAGDHLRTRRRIAEAGRDLSGLSRYARSYYHLAAGIDALLRGDVNAAMGEQAALLAVTWQCGSPWLWWLGRLFSAQVVLAAGGADADAHVPDAKEVASQLKSPLFEFMALLTEADAARRAGATARAVQILARAMPIGRAHGFVNTWLWLPAMMAELAALALDADIESEYVRQLVRERKLVPSEPPVDAEMWPWPVKIFTLGRFEVLIDERPLRFTGKAQRKPLALLRTLVALGGDRVREDRLTELLWPDADGDAARQALSTTLHRLRRLLGLDRAIVRADGGISLAREHCWVDVWALERMIARAEAAIARSPVRDHEWAAAIRWTDRAVVLYQGEFMTGEPVPEGIAGLGDRLRDRLLRQLRKMGHLWEIIGDWQEAAECYERAVSLHDCAEEFYRRLMIAYERLDRRGDAILTYERCRKTLSSALGIPPSRETEAVRRDLLSPGGC